MPQGSSVGKCPYCPMYYFMSETDKNRHLTVLHHDKKGKFLCTLSTFYVGRSCKVSIECEREVRYGVKLLSVIYPIFAKQV